MITYERFAFGLNLVFRIHGSATYRSVLPALGSVLVLYGFRSVRNNTNVMDETPEVGHPYVVGVVVSGITFLIVFRASQGYSRYWEAASSVYGMMSKWMDATVHTASFHMQCTRYEHIMPPSFQDFPDMDRQFLTRDREREGPRLRRRKQGKYGVTPSSRNLLNKRAAAHSINAPPASRGEASSLRPAADDPLTTSTTSNNGAAAVPTTSSGRDSPDTDDTNEDTVPTTSKERTPSFLTGKTRRDGNWGALFQDGTATFYNANSTLSEDKRGFASLSGGRTPPLFLQELAHLSSLMTAVGLSTLRNDVDGAESPLCFYEPGSPWPEVDPGVVPELYQDGWHRAWATFLSFVGRGRTPIERTRYNALRPLPVLGGVSETEIQFLQLARGPYAKTQLCWHWLSEFISREHLAGSLGDIGAPIISRVMQFLGDGMMNYNHARKIMFIPFPFVHAQHSAIFVIVMMGVIPFLMDQYCEDLWTGGILTFLSVACLSGIHELARELENPFRNVPNELPIVTLMAQYNEALLVMYSGFHPDAYWEAPPPPSTTSRGATPSTTTPVRRRSSFHDEVSVPRSTSQSSLRSSWLLDAVPEEERPNESRPPHGVVLDNHQQDVATSPITTYFVGATPTRSASPQVVHHPRTAAVAGTDPLFVPTLPPQVHRATTRDDDNAAAESPASPEEPSQLDQLRAIVLEQGRAMTTMLQEQARLNKLLEQALLASSSNKDATTTVNDDEKKEEFVVEA